MSFKNYKRSVILDFNYDSVKDGVPKASQQMALLNSQFRKQSAELAKNGSSAEKMSLKYQQLTSAVEIQAGKVTSLSKELEDLNKSEDKNKKIINRKTIELNNAEATLMSYENQVEKLKKEMEAQNSIFEQTSLKIKEANQQMDILSSEFKKQSEELNRNGSLAEKTSLKHQQLTKAVQIQSDKVSLLATELEALNKSENKNKEAINKKTIELNNAEATLTSYENQVERLNREMESQNNIFGQTALKIEDYKYSLEEAGINIDQVAGQMQKVGAILSGVGLAGLKMHMSLDEVMVKVDTIADTSVISIDKLREGVLDLSGEFGVASNEIAGGLYNIISGNIETVDSLELLREATILTETGFTDMETATKLLTQIINAYGLEVKDASSIVDKLIKMQKLGQVTVGEFGDQFGKIAGMAAKANIPLEEVMGTISTLTALGLEHNEAMTGMSAILSALVKPTKQAKEQAEALGINFSLGAVEAKGFANFIGEVARKTNGSDEAIANLFGRVSGINSMFILAGKGADKFSEDIDEIANSAGTADEAIDKILESARKKWEISKEKLINTLTLAGAALEPLIDLITAFIGLISEIPPEIIVIMSVLGMALFMVGTVIKLVSSLSTSLTLMSNIFGFTVTPVILKVAAAVGILVAGLVTVLTLIAAIKGKTGDVTAGLEAAANTTKELGIQAQGAGQRTNRQVQGSFKRGMPRIPRDRMNVEVHEGEEILSADDPRNQNNPNFNGSSGDNYYLNVNMNEVDEVYKLIKVFQDFKQVKRGGFI